MKTIIRKPVIPLRLDTDKIIRVGKTRVTLDTVVAAFNEGATAEEIVFQYPALELSDVYGAISYYLHYRLEVDAYLQKRSAISESIRKQNESQYNAKAIRERLETRKQSINKA